MEIAQVLQIVPAKPIVEPVVIEEVVEVTVIQVPQLNLPIVKCDKDLEKFLDSLDDMRDGWNE